MIHASLWWQQKTAHLRTRQSHASTSIHDVNKCTSLSSQFSVLISRFQEQGGKQLVTEALENECLLNSEALRFGKEMTSIRLSPLQIPYPISPFYLLQFDCLVFSSFFQKQDFLGVRHVYVTSFPVANQSRFVALRFCIQLC